MTSNKFRLAFAALIVAAMTPAAAQAANEMTVHRDPGCGCCGAWAKQVAGQLGRKYKLVDNPARAALVKRSGVPDALRACHTTLIDGAVIEGHVPAADIKRFFTARPKGMTGLAVAGMPIGTPGMEAPGRKPERFAVVAFGPGRQTLFARH
ncbi:DUF411 domain-containing protein [Sphingopyxis sp.]|uniref:DUF411 domain-containing protein n=1 Tax=Sphingomonadales TaxID=204457 RepID=UPI003F6FA877